MASKRRRPDLSGLAGLSRADFDAWRLGRVRQEDIATRLGVSVPAISRKFGQWITKLSSQPVPAVTYTPATPSPVQAEPLGTFSSDDAIAVAKSACVGVLIQTHALLAGPGAVGPSGLKAAAAAIRDSIDILGRLGVLNLTAIAAVIPQALIIRRLTEAEEVKIRLEVEAGDPDYDPTDDSPVVTERRKAA